MNRFVLEKSDELWPKAFPKDFRFEKLYGIGNPALLDLPAISIIGARRGSPYGLSVATLIARIAAEKGIVVVSGGAVGVDATASRAALEAGGKTVVVPGSGPDVIYPKSSEDVFRNAWERGVVLSPFDFGIQPLRWAFRERNKVIAALCKVLVVTEANIPSGTFSTADYAASIGRTIFAVPGSIYSPYSKGTNKLIEEGAQILVDAPGIETALAQEFGHLASSTTSASPEQQNPIIKALFAEPLRPDDLARLLDVNVFDILQELSAFEVEGVLERLPDGRFSPTKQAFIQSATPP